MCVMTSLVTSLHHKNDITSQRHKVSMMCQTWHITHTLMLKITKIAYHGMCKYMFGPTDLVGRLCDATPSPTYLGASPQSDPVYCFIKPLFTVKALKIKKSENISSNALE